MKTGSMNANKKAPAIFASASFSVGPVGLEPTTNGL
jgi:hypothetical protein